MRKARFIGGPNSIYHCLSRVVDRRFVLDQPAKQKFVELMRRQADFCGIQVLTHCIMSNHFHLLLRVPPPKAVDEAEYLRRLEVLNGHLAAQKEAAELSRLRAMGGDLQVELHLDRVRARMYNLAAFMKELKQRFSQWHNHRHKRKGTLWEERYKSLLVEDADEALLTIAHYLEMNPVRAGICRSPEAYRWNGLGAALRGDQRARQGLRIIMQLLLHRSQSVRQALEAYPANLLEKTPPVLDKAGQALPGTCAGDSARPLSGLNRSALLRCRIRHFSDGVVLGSRAFLEASFFGKMDFFGSRRRTAPRRIRQAGQGRLYCARDYADGITQPAGTPRDK